MSGFEIYIAHTSDIGQIRPVDYAATREEAWKKHQYWVKVTMEDQPGEMAVSCSPSETS